MSLKPFLSFLLIVFASLSSHAQITINEINYRSITAHENIEFIELYNFSENTIDLGGWHFTNGIDYTFPEHIIIQPDSFLIIAGNTENCSTFFEVSNVIGPWSGKLGNSGDVIELRNQAFVIVDKVGYDGWKEWPAINHKDIKVRKDTPKGTIYIPQKVELSLQKINPEVSGKLAGSWRSHDPTPGTLNTEALIADISKTPIIKGVSRSANQPSSGEEVEVLVKLTNIDAVKETLKVSLLYQVVHPGNYLRKSSAEFNSQENWTKVTMETVKNEKEVTVFSANIPKSVQAHRRLIRYKVHVKTKSNFEAYYPHRKHRESNYAYYVNDGQQQFEGASFSDLSALQSIALITSEEQVNNYVLKGNFEDYIGEGTLVYNGKVYDHIRYRARGKNSRHNKVKRNLKFSLNSSRPLTPHDDYGTKYKQPRSKIALSGGWINDANSHGLTESLIYKIAALTGGFNKHTDYCQLRIVDRAEEDGLEGDFWGVYQLLEDWGGTMLAEHQLPDGNIYTYKKWTLSHQGENGPYGESNDEYNQWNEGIGNSKDGKSTDKRQDVSLDFLVTHLDLDHYFADLLLTEITCNGETNYMGQHSYREYYNPETKKWIAQCGDYDETFGSNHNKQSVYPRSQSRHWRNASGLLKKEVLAYDSMKTVFSNMLRSTIDLLVNEEQINLLLTSESGLIYDSSRTTNWTDLDYNRWSEASGGEMAYDNYQTDVIDWYYNWFFARAHHLLNDSLTYNNYNEGEEKTSPVENIFYQEEVLAPKRPTIDYSGPNSYALDQLSFKCSDFMSETSSFKGIEWRVGEWSDPKNAHYDSDCDPIYEIESLWNSGELSEDHVSFSIPEEAFLKPGRSYKIRARYKDQVGRWSHWSSPIQIIPTAASQVDVPNLVISEIMFDPSSECGVEFIRLTNNGFFSADLSHIELTEGVFYRFKMNSSLPGGQSLFLTKDSVLFIQKYGFSPFGEYDNSLANKGENVKLIGAFDQVINEVHYLKDDSWETDNSGHSLILTNTSQSTKVAKNWKWSEQPCGTPMLGVPTQFPKVLLIIVPLVIILLVFWWLLKRRKNSKINGQD